MAGPRSGASPGFEELVHTALESGGRRGDTVAPHAVVARFDTPGSLRDAPPGSAFYDNWHRRVARLLKDRTPGNGRGEFVDPSVVALEPVCEPTYAWTGFPRPHLVVNHRDDREAAFAAGEDRLAQHEYLEWHVDARRARARSPR